MELDEWKNASKKRIEKMTFDEAREILESLSGDTHSVFTSVAVFYKNQVCTFVDETKVTFKNINDFMSFTIQ